MSNLFIKCKSYDWVLRFHKKMKWYFKISRSFYVKIWHIFSILIKPYHITHLHYFPSLLIQLHNSIETLSTVLALNFRGVHFGVHIPGRRRLRRGQQDYINRIINFSEAGSHCKIALTAHNPFTGPLARPRAPYHRQRGGIVHACAINSSPTIFKIC